MKIVLNNIYTLDKYFFIDISMINKTKIRYDIDQIRFKIEDKKQTKATNFQSIEILPLMQVNKNLVSRRTIEIFLSLKNLLSQTKKFLP